MKLLIEIEGPGADRPVPGEPGIIEQLEGYLRRLMAQRSHSAVTTITVRRLDPDVVPVKADQLARLQKKLSSVENILAKGGATYSQLKEALK